MFKKAMTLSLLVLVAVAVGTGITYALQVSDNLVFTEQTDVVLLYGGDDFVSTGQGNDDIFMGLGNDIISLADDDDVLDFWGGNDFITFGEFDGWPSPANAVNYISCNTPEAPEAPFDSTMEVRSDEVVITANSGDVIIQLGY